MPKRRNIKAVLFDLDGTLLDTESLSDRAILRAFGESLPAKIQEERRHAGDLLPWEIKKQIVGKRGDEWIPMIISYAQEHWGVATNESSHNVLSPPSVNDLWNMWESNLNSFCSEIKECKGATNLVETLAKRNIRMAIATSSRAASVAKKRIHHERIFTPMAAVVTGDDPSVKNGKPAPDIFLEAARRLGVDPTECLVFEDSTSGCQSAKAAGCFVIAVPDPRMDKSAFDGIADQVLDNLTCFDDDACGLDLTVDL